MQQIIEQPLSLVKFLADIEITSSNMTGNLLDKELSFVSYFYTPNLNISIVGQEVLDFLKNGNVKISTSDLDTKSLVKRIEKSNLRKTNSTVYRILQITILEIYAIVNTFKENQENIEKMKQSDLIKLSQNIEYVCDFLGDYDEYSSIIEDLRNISLDVDYVKLQLPLIKTEGVSI